MELIKERGKTHGMFELTASLAVQLQELTRTKVGEPPIMRHALDMICVKLARIVSGDPSHADHWRDIAGYASLIADEIAKREARAAVKPQDAPPGTNHG